MSITNFPVFNGWPCGGSPTPAAEVASDGLDLGGKSAQADGHLAIFACELAFLFANDCQVEQVKNEMFKTELNIHIPLFKFVPKSVCTFFGGYLIRFGWPLRSSGTAPDAGEIGGQRQNDEQ